MGEKLSGNFDFTPAFFVPAGLTRVFRLRPDDKALFFLWEINAILPNA
jgi:hypothetical protein